jgi:flagellar biosynthesis/type III secretory pathway ATPase
VRKLRELYALYRQHADLVNMGAYAVGSDARIDAALDIYPRLMAFLRQESAKSVSLAESLAALADLAPVDSGRTLSVAQEKNDR